MKEKNRIIDELDELSAEYLKNNKLGPLQKDMPLDYFKSMQEVVLSGIRIDIQSGLNIKDKPSEDYFNIMQEEVIEKLRPAKVRNLPPFYKVLAVAASFLVLFSFGYLLLTNIQKESNFTVLQKNLTEDELNYILENYSTEEDFQFIETMDDINSEINQIQSDELDEKVIEEIMSEEDIDYLDEIM